VDVLGAGRRVTVSSRPGMTVAIERLGALPPEAFSALLAESEREGLSLLRRLADEWASGANRFDRPGEALFGAWMGPELVGLGGLNVDPYAGTDRAGRVRHLYVRPAARGRGIGERLVTEIVEAARGRFESLRLRTANPGAARLYERMGFRPCADVPHCTHLMTMPRPGRGAQAEMREEGASMQARTCEGGAPMPPVSAVHDAVRCGDLERLTALLARDPSLANARSRTDARGTYPLHVAAEFGQAAAARALLDRGADVALLDSENDAIALCWAAFFGRPDVVAALLEGGSAPSHRNRHGLTPLGCAMGGARGQWRQFSDATLDDWQRAAEIIRARGGVE